MNTKLSERLKTAAKRCGGLRAVAAKSGVKEATLANWRAGTEPKAYALAAVATAANVSLEWLATGEGPMERNPKTTVVPAALDLELLQMIIEEVDLFIDEYNLQWPAEKKTRVIVSGYDMMADEQGPEETEKATTTLAHLLKAAV